MKKLLLSLAVVASIAGVSVAGVAQAAPKAKTVTKAAAVQPYKLPASYRAVYCYPTGSY